MCATQNTSLNLSDNGDHLSRPSRGEVYRVTPTTVADIQDHLIRDTTPGFEGGPDALVNGPVPNAINPLP